MYWSRVSAYYYSFSLARETLFLHPVFSIPQKFFLKVLSFMYAALNRALRLISPTARFFLFAIVMSQMRILRMIVEVETMRHDVTWSLNRIGYEASNQTDSLDITLQNCHTQKNFPQLFNWTTFTHFLFPCHVSGIHWSVSYWGILCAQIRKGLGVPCDIVHPISYRTNHGYHRHPWCLPTPLP